MARERCGGLFWDVSGCSSKGNREGLRDEAAPCTRVGAGEEGAQVSNGIVCDALCDIRLSRKEQARWVLATGGRLTGGLDIEGGDRRHSSGISLQRGDIWSQRGVEMDRNEKKIKKALRTENYILPDWTELYAGFRNSWETSREKSRSQLWPRRKEKIGLLYRRHEYAGSGLIWHCSAPHSDSTAHWLRALVNDSLGFTLYWSLIIVTVDKHLQMEYPDVFLFRGGAFPAIPFGFHFVPSFHHLKWHRFPLYLGKSWTGKHSSNISCLAYTSDSLIR